MIRKIPILLLFFIPFTLKAQNWKAFTDTAGKFTAQYPSTWTNKIKQGNRVFFTSPSESASDKFYENINISVTENASYGKEVKLREMFPAVEETIQKQFVEYKQESFTYFTWNNMDAAELIYTGYPDDTKTLKIRSTQWYCFFKGRLYIATFVSVANNDTFNATARKIMNSIIFK